MITKTRMVPKHPPPSFEAPYPAIKPLNILFINLNLKQKAEFNSSTFCIGFNFSFQLILFWHR